MEKNVKKYEVAVNKQSNESKEWTKDSLHFERTESQQRLFAIIVIERIIEKEDTYIKLFQSYEKESTINQFFFEYAITYAELTIWNAFLAPIASTPKLFQNMHNAIGNKEETLIKDAIKEIEERLNENKN